MTVPVWVAELAAAFWAEAEEIESFPRKLVRTIRRAVPLSVVLLPHLSIASILSWLSKNGIVCDLAAADRVVRACLVSFQGQGFAFIDGADPENEQRFSVAHELAHFLRDYWYPRRQALKRLGPAALQVLDGLRPPTAQERIHALLSYTPIGFHVHLLDRDDEGNPASGPIADAEESANRLAYELLAPAEHVLGSLSCPSRPDAVETLVKDYGLPEQQAVRYTGLLFSSARPMDPLLARLKIGS